MKRNSSPAMQDRSQITYYGVHAKRERKDTTNDNDYVTPERRLSEMNPTYSLLTRAGMVMITRPVAPSSLEIPKKGSIGTSSNISAEP